MRNLLLPVLTAAVVLTAGIIPVSAETVTREDLEISAEGVHMVRFKDISHADLSYKGIEGADRFSVRFEKKVRNVSDNDIDAVLSRIGFDMNVKDGTVEMVLIHPGEKATGIINRVLDRNDWSVVIEITGPIVVDTDVKADFSTVKMSDTEGMMTADTDFGDTIIRNHTGSADVTNGFGSLRVENLDGYFTVKGDYSDVNITMSRIAGNCSGSSSFAHFSLMIPRDAGAEIVTNTSFGNATISTKDFSEYHKKSGNYIIGEGGPVIDLRSQFGNITVRDSGSPVPATASTAAASSAFLPLVKDAWWRLKGDNGTVTVTVEKTRTSQGRTHAVLLVTGAEGILRLTVFENSQGLYVENIDGTFFGREITGITFTPEKLWLPYDESLTVDNDYILGTVKSERIGELETPYGVVNDVLRAAISLGESSHVIYLSPGVGIVGIDSYLLEALDRSVKSTVEVAQTAKKPRFESGVVSRITITGNRRLSEAEIRNALEVKEGEFYTRKQIYDAVKKLEKYSRFTSHTYYTIDADGNLSIRISERKTHTNNMEAVVSFNRIGGVGLGPELNFNSLVGPITDIKASAQYHFANSEWTYKGLAEKSFFDSNRLAFGGTYRLDYESPMKWAIPENESSMNAFLVGLETQHLYFVEGSTGYVSFSLGNRASLKAEYFEDKYESLKKHTNYSFFNHRHVKDDNLPLSPMDEDRLAGFRAVGTFNYSLSDFSSNILLEAEKAPDSGNNKMGEYTRYFGNYVAAWQFTRDSYLKVRMAGGYSEDFLPAPRAFNLGGLNTLRGYDYQSIPDAMPFSFQYGGNRMALCNIEYLVGSEDEAGLILFADAGNAWLKGETAKFDDLRRDIGVSLAFGSDFMSDNAGSLFEDIQGVRINWAVPVGNVPHTSHWTVNFCRTF